MGLILEFSDNDKFPGFVGKTVYGAGPISLGSIPLRLLLVGLQRYSGSTAQGTMTADAAPIQVLSIDDADTYCGAGGELNRMVRAAFEIDGVDVWIAAPSITSATAASATATIGGTWSTGGSFKVIIAGDTVTVNVASTDTTTTAAQALVDAVNERPEMAVIASRSSAVVTFTMKSPGARGNDSKVYVVKKDVPSGLTVTLGGGGATVGGDMDTGDGVKFASGAGTEDVTDLLDALFLNTWDRVAFAQRDATNLALWETHLDNKAGPLEGRLQHAVCASPGTQSAATSLAQTTLNHWRTQLLWMEESDTPAPELAAEFAARRVQKEQSTPNVSYSGDEFTWAKGHRSSAKVPARTAATAALNDGVTPISTNQDGKAFIVRSITTRSQTSDGNPDYRTLDTSDAVVPDYVRNLLKLYWQTVYRPAHLYVRDDPSTEEPDPPAEVATPRLWNVEVIAQLKELVLQNILMDVDENLPKSTWNDVANRIETDCPVMRLPLNEQQAVLVRQLSA
ncbi:MAG: hypothetical protein ACTHU0_01290 [Kofleriaceae bacterium]